MSYDLLVGMFFGLLFGLIYSMILRCLPPKAPKDQGFGDWWDDEEDGDE